MNNPFYNLPKEMVDDIVSYLPYIDVIRLSQVDKFLNETYNAVQETVKKLISGKIDITPVEYLINNTIDIDETYKNKIKLCSGLIECDIYKFNPLESLNFSESYNLKKGKYIFGLITTNEIENSSVEHHDADSNDFGEITNTNKYMHYGTYIFENEFSMLELYEDGRVTFSITTAPSCNNFTVGMICIKDIDFIRTYELLNIYDENYIKRDTNKYMRYAIIFKYMYSKLDEKNFKILNDDSSDPLIFKYEKNKMYDNCLHVNIKLLLEMCYEEGFKGYYYGINDEKYITYFGNYNVMFIRLIYTITLCYYSNPLNKEAEYNIIRNMTIFELPSNLTPEYITKYINFTNVWKRMMHEICDNIHALFKKYDSFDDYLLFDSANYRTKILNEEKFMHEIIENAMLNGSFL